jgi:hypothetical protein
MVQFDHKQAAWAARAAASQELRRRSAIAFGQAARASTRRRRRRPFAGHPRPPTADQAITAAAKAERTATRARALIFLTARTTDNGQHVSKIFPIALRRAHPDTAAPDQAGIGTDAAAVSAVEALQQARQALKDSRLWS